MGAAITALIFFGFFSFYFGVFALLKKEQQDKLIKFANRLHGEE